MGKFKVIFEDFSLELLIIKYLKNKISKDIEKVSNIIYQHELIDIYGIDINITKHFIVKYLLQFLFLP